MQGDREIFGLTELFHNLGLLFAPVPAEDRVSKS